jgi:hypothetical protein
MMHDVEAEGNECERCVPVRSQVHGHNEGLYI